MMKSSVYLLAVLCLGSFSCEDELADKDVPEAVKSGLTASFPEAGAIEWEKEGDNYEAEFIFNSQEYEALLTPGGDVLKFKHPIQETELPEAVITTVGQNHAGMLITEPEKMQVGDGVYFQLELEKEDQELQQVYTADGSAVTDPAYWD